jgi:hypothetical protein
MLYNTYALDNIEFQRIVETDGEPNANHRNEELNG